MLHALGGGQAGVDSVDANAFAGEGVGQAGAGQHQRGVGGAAGQVRRRGQLAAHADDVDDRAGAAPRHAGQHGVDGVDIGEVLGVHRRVPVGGSQLGGRRAPGGAGRIDQHADGACLRLVSTDLPKQ